MSTKAFTLSGVSLGKVHKVKFIVDSTDAHIVRAHSWTLRIRKGSVSYLIGRMANGVSISLAQDIMNPPEGKRVFHKNLNSMDFRRENLYVAVGDGKDYCLRGHYLLDGGSYMRKSNGTKRCKICESVLKKTAAGKINDQARRHNRA